MLWRETSRTRQVPAELAGRYRRIGRPPQVVDRVFYRHCFLQSCHRRVGVPGLFGSKRFRFLCLQADDNYPVRYCVDSAAANVSRLQLGRVRRGFLIRQSLVLRRDDIHRTLGVPEAPQLEIGIFEISEIVKIPIGARFACALYIGLRYFPAPQVRGR